VNFLGRRKISGQSLISGGNEKKAGRKIERSTFVRRKEVRQIPHRSFRVDSEYLIRAVLLRLTHHGDRSGDCSKGARAPAGRDPAFTFVVSVRQANVPRTFCESHAISALVESACCLARANMGLAGIMVGQRVPHGTEAGDKARKQKQHTVQ